MIRINKKIKITLIVLTLLLAGGGVASYFVFFKKTPTSEAPSIKVEQDKKVDDVLSYIKTEKEFSNFSTLLAKLDLTKYQAASPDGVKPKLVILAPLDSAFEKEESKTILKISDQLKDEVTKFHIVSIIPTDTNKQAELTLKDGESLKTITNQLIIVKKSGNDISLIDGKGRTAKVKMPKVIGNDGTILLKIDNILLFQ